jgi:TRAP-type mannitol/chloroaromatic compound transport system substrate-binding protein
MPKEYEFLLEVVKYPSFAAIIWGLVKALKWLADLYKKNSDNYETNLKELTKKHENRIDQYHTDLLAEMKKNQEAFAQINERDKAFELILQKILQNLDYRNGEIRVLRESNDNIKDLIERSQKLINIAKQ